MKRGTYFRLLLLSLVAALLLSALSLFLLNRLMDLAASRHRNEFISFFVENIERKLAPLSYEDLKSPKTKDLLELPFPGPFGGRRSLGGPGMSLPLPGDFRRGPPPPGFDGLRSPMPPPPPMDGFRPPRPPPPDIWLVSESGEILNASMPGKPLPQHWDDLPKSNVTNEIATKTDFLRLAASINIVKLNRTPTVYFVISEERRSISGALLLTQAGLTFAMILMALLMSFSSVFYYLRKKSEEARAVLLRLEQGDLKARFEIKRLDEFGGLLLDFNRMAHEIERLVTRVHTTETTRKNLLQELGHDLRTPLTSLATSFETLRDHYDKMTQTDRDDLFEMTAAEVEYFKDLLEKLMTIAALDEPNYKESTELMDLRELLNQELRVRQTNSKLQWRLSAPSENPIFASGDAILILRLFKNALDNASRYAISKIEVDISHDANESIIQIKDDGPGLTAKELDSFAKRRDQRTRREGDRLHFSLGLGSVIMKAIADLHGGTVEIKNISQTEKHGAILTIRLPQVKTTEK